MRPVAEVALTEAEVFVGATMGRESFSLSYSFSFSPRFPLGEKENEKENENDY